MKKHLIIDCGSVKVPEIENILFKSSIVFNTVKLDQLISVEGYSSIIISGAPILLTATSHESFLEKAKIIFQNINLPILGICFGHQLMGIFHGSTIARCNESRTWEKINFIDEFDLLPNHTGMLEMFEDHCECITLPDNFKLLASSLTCVNEAMKHKQKPWYGVQFHPEVSNQQGHELILNFIHLTNQ